MNIEALGSDERLVRVGRVVKSISLPGTKACGKIWGGKKPRRPLSGGGGEVRGFRQGPHQRVTYVTADDSRRLLVCFNQESPATARLSSQPGRCVEQSRGGGDENGVTHTSEEAAGCSE